MATKRELEIKRQSAKLNKAKTDNNKKLVKQEIQPDKIDELRHIFMKDIFPDDESIKECADLVVKSKRLTPKQIEKKDELAFELVMKYGLKNGIWAKNLDHDKYYEALEKIRHDIVAECSCKNSLELMIADRIVANYWRAMKCDRIFNRLMENEDGKFSFDQLKVNILKELNKGMDFANRQLNANIILLKELKQPKLNVKVNTRSAFIGENQQFNVNKQKNENIEPK